MGVPTLEVGYTSATIGRGDHEVHKGQVVALGQKKISEPCIVIHKREKDQQDARFFLFLKYGSR
jgi:hypothetical protein